MPFSPGLHQILSLFRNSLSLTKSMLSPLNLLTEYTAHETFSVNLRILMRACMC